MYVTSCMLGKHYVSVTNMTMMTEAHLVPWPNNIYTIVTIPNLLLVTSELHATLCCKKMVGELGNGDLCSISLL